MWHFISEEISTHLKKEFICDDIRQINNGDSHSAYKITDGRQRYFVKVNTAEHLANFVAESEGLQHLQKTQLFKVPHVICLGTTEDKSYLVLEFLTLSQDLNNNWLEFGQLLAQLHQTQIQQQYGWQADNYIGLSPQHNQWNTNWSQFFAEQRIGTMLQRLQQKGHHLGSLEIIVKKIGSLLADHKPVPSLLHGDLWKGNTGFNKNKPVIFDPACYFGDRETDIAMTELFGPFPDDFYQGYQEIWPLSNDYQFRKPIYQLYHTLNHALTFEGHYLESAKSILQDIMAYPHPIK